MPVNPIGSEFRVNTFTNGNQRTYGESPQAIAMDSDGDFVVTWSSFGQDGSGFGVYGQRYSAAGVAQGGEFQVNTAIDSFQLYSTVAMDSDGDFVVTWSSLGQDGNNWGVYGQRYSAAGVAQGSEFQVNTTTNLSQLYSTVAMDSDGDFVVTWSSLGQDDGDGSLWDIYGQRYSAAGIAQGSQFQVNTDINSFQVYSTVAMDSDGDFVVTWSSLEQDGSGYGVYGQRYSAAGIAQGSEFKVNATTSNDQLYSMVAMDSDGDFVVTWSSYGQDGSGWGVYGQRYSAAGVAQGGEFKVNSTTSSSQAYSTVAMDSDGDFVVTWSSYGQDGDVYGIYGQRYSAAGVAQGGEFKVNSTTSDYQQFSTVAMDSDGDFVVTWTSNGQDGSESGVYAQRYGITPNVIVDTVAPTAEIIDINPDVRDTSVSTIAFQFSEAVVNFEVSDLVLTRDGSPVALNGATLTPSSGDRSWTLTLPDSLTAVEGRYQLTLAQGSLTDLAGNALELGTSDGWLTGRTATALPAINFQGGKRIRGTNRSETIQGLFRNDVLLGLGGNDTLTTESKRAKLSGVDRLYGGSGNDTLSAGQGNDLLDGGSGRDRLLGGNGNDQLLGGSGNDMLVGDAGKDTFVFKGLNEGKDVIAGFNAAEDLIDLRSIMSRTEYGGDNAFARFRQFVQLQQVGANTEVRVDADGSGVGQTFTTLAMLQNTALNAVSARNFVIA